MSEIKKNIWGRHVWLAVWGLHCLVFGRSGPLLRVPSMFHRLFPPGWDGPDGVAVHSVTCIPSAQPAHVRSGTALENHFKADGICLPGSNLLMRDAYVNKSIVI